MQQVAVEESNEVLSASNRPEIPTDVIEFLHKYNGISCNDGCVWGVDGKKHTLYDILAENLVANNKSPEEILLLGENTMTYIAWNQSTKRYSMLDKSTFLELHNFASYAEAVSYILKIIR